MSTTTAPPAALNAAASRISSMGYGDIYGASDAAGPSAAVAGSVGYVDATTAPAPQAAPAPAAAGLTGLVELGHDMLDSPAGLAFLLGGGLLLVLWRELA